ncbi:unnamed protein product [Ixodes pacificus]
MDCATLSHWPRKLPVKHWANFIGCISLIIIPAKAFSLPVMTMAPTVESLLSSSMASPSSSMRGLQRALRALGRFSVISATFCWAPLFSTRMCWYEAAMRDSEFGIK